MVKEYRNGRSTGVDAILGWTKYWRGYNSGVDAVQLWLKATNDAVERIPCLISLLLPMDKVVMLTEGNDKTDFQLQNKAKKDSSSLKKKIKQVVTMHKTGQARKNCPK